MTPTVERFDKDRRIAVIGTGVIGASWCAHFLGQGFKVVAADPAPRAEEHLRKLVDEFWPDIQALGTLAEGASPRNLSFADSIGEAVTDSQFIQESGPERLEIKRSMIAEMEEAAPGDTIIASSSSGLMVSDFQAGAQHPERVLLGHPFSPPHLIPLVEVIGGVLTSPDNVARAMALYAATGKKPIRINKEVKGHIANRLQVALWQEAFSLVEKGVCSIEDIDTAIAYGPGLRWALLGPFLNLHAQGGPGGITHMLEHLGPAMREWAGDLGHYPDDEDYIAPIAAGVQEELDGQDFSAMLAERNQILIELLTMKRRSSQLP